MSESIDILIAADDQASKKFADVSKNIAESNKRVEQVIKSLEPPIERYNRDLAELVKLQASGRITAEQFAAAQNTLQGKLKGTSNSFKEVGASTKATTEFAGALAALTGNSELAGMAGQMASLTERTSQFSEISKAGGASAMAFKLGLVGLAAAVGFAIGKKLGNIIFQTEKFEKAMKDAKEESIALDKQLRTMQSNLFSNTKEDIELIRNPDEKRAAYQQLFNDLNRDISTASAKVQKSKRDVDEWADAWQVTGERKAMAQEANEQLQADKEKLEILKEQRSEIAKLISVRTQENEKIAKANEAKAASEKYLETLAKEVDYLKATRDEQIKLDALHNTTDEDRGEAERLLKERDAVLERIEAEKELEATKKRAIEDAAKAVDKQKQDAENEIQRVEDLKGSIREKLELQRIELEQGKEAARTQDLINRGIDAATAKQLAAEEAQLDSMKQKTTEKSTVDPVTSFESRLLTRGPGSRMDWRDEMKNLVREVVKNTKGTVRMVPNI